MKTRDILDKELLAAPSHDAQPSAALLGHYRLLADSYARLENAVAVLSDMRTNESYVYYGGFAKMLALQTRAGKLPSIWEDAIFSIVHPDDLDAKHLQELCFYNFIKRQPKERRADYCLMSRLRMRTVGGGYAQVLHRMFYVYAPSGSRPWLALCLYGALVHELPARCIVADTVRGTFAELGKREGESLLSEREKQVLALIHRGLTSKEIAASLFISVNTVSRHRQEILSKLRVKNSVEACRVAEALGIISRSLS